jgi:hypothetical protein
MTLFMSRVFRHAEFRVGFPESWKDWFQLNGPKLLLCALPQVELREDSQPARRMRVF